MASTNSSIFLISFCEAFVPSLVARNNKCVKSGLFKTSAYVLVILNCSNPTAYLLLYSSPNLDNTSFNALGFSCCSGVNKPCNISLIFDLAIWILAEGNK